VSYNFDGYRDSGIERIRSLRAAGVEPDLWVIQLGTNDLGAVKNCRCDDQIVFAGDLIDRLLAELPADTPIAWVNLMNRADFDVTNAFNEALRRRAVAEPYFRRIDWARRSLPRPDWFVDPVHLTFEGVVQFTQMYVDDIGALLDSPPGPTPPRPGLQRAIRIGTPLR
jgi:lysophospholipase L1-like esterase